MLIYTIAFSLFIIMDPIGNIPCFAAVLRNFDPKRQVKIIARELLLALLIMILFEFLGNLILTWLHIEVSHIQISGGIILFLIAIGMIFPSLKMMSSFGADQDPILVPLAVPLVAGPSILAAIMVYSKQVASNAHLTLSILLAWTVSTAILLASPFLKKLVRERGLMAVERLMGLILTFMSIQMLLDGLKSYMASSF